MKYRSRMDIISTVLQSAMRGATKTRIMYSAYLSYAQLKEYLAYLEEKGLLVHDEENQLYRLTEKGLHFLNVYDEVKQFLPIGDGRREQNATPAPRSFGQEVFEIQH